jgi:hypothetical protein
MKNIHSLKGEIRGIFSVMLYTTRGATLRAICNNTQRYEKSANKTNFGELFLHTGGGNLLIFKYLV